MVEDALVAGVVEGFEDLGDCDGAVFGDDADGVAGGVGHALVEGELDVAGLFLRAFAGEEVVVGHGGEEGVVAGVFGGVSRGRIGLLVCLICNFGHVLYGKTHRGKTQSHLNELQRMSRSIGVFLWSFGGVSAVLSW